MATVAFLRSVAAACLLVSCAALAFAQAPVRELDVPPGTVLNGLAPNGLAYSAQTVWALNATGPAQTAWSTQLGISVADVGSDGHATGARYVLHSDGSFYVFNVNGSTISAPSRTSTIVPLSSFGETFRKVIGNPLEVVSSRHAYKSDDGGVSWNPDTAGLGTATTADMASDSGVGLLMLTSGQTGGMYRRAVTDTVWKKDTSVKITGMTVVFVDRHRRIFIGAGNQGAYGSTDNGATWTRDSAGMGARSISRFNDDAYGNVYAITDQGQRIYRTANGGQSWTRIDAAVIPAYVDPVSATTFYNVTGDSILYCGTAYGLFASTDQGLTWAEHNGGILAENIGTIEHLPSGRSLVTTDLGVFKRDRSETAWTRMWPTAGYLRLNSIFHDNSGVLYLQGPRTSASNNATRITLKSTDQGSTWTVDSAGISLVRRSGTFFVDEAGVQHLAVGASGGGTPAPAVIYAKPPAGPWALDTSGFVSTGASDAPTSFASNGSGQVFLAGAYSGGNIWMRPVTGGAWVLDTAGADTARILAMRRDPKGNIVAAARYGRFFRRVAGRWTRIAPPGGRDSSDAYMVALDSTGTIATAYRTLTTGFVLNGVYMSKDSGATWHLAGLQNYTITNLVSYGDTTYGMIAGRGAFRMSSNFKPALHLVSTDLSFGTVNTGEYVDVPLLLTNSGSDTLHVTAVTIDNAAFVPRQSSVAIAPGVTFRDTIRFTPTSAGVISGTATITSDAATSPDHVSLIGVGRASSLSLSARTIAFGAQRTGRTALQTVVVTNHGADTLRVTAITSSSPVFSARPATLAIPPGASATDTLAFTPVATGPAQGVMILASNSPSSPDTIRVSGTGTGPLLSLRSSTIRCGTAKVGQPLLSMFQITNMGTDTLTIASITSSNPAFVITQMANVVAPGTFITDSIIFTPSIVDTNRGILKIFSDAPSSPDSALMYGIGTPASGVNDMIPGALTIGEAYPNPVHEITDIPLTLAMSGRVQIDIVDALGRRVNNVLDDALEEGAHVVHIARSLLPAAAGTYYVTFRGTGFEGMRQIVVVR